jgi:hypothetical protein
MRNIIDSYRRPILAIFGVLLMVVFMMPSSMKSASDRNNQVIGHIGKAAVYAQENSGAEQDWEIVSRRIQFRTNDQQHPWIPLAAALLPAPSAYNAIAANKESFLLLVKEAEKRGVTLSTSDVSQVLDDPRVGIVQGEQLVAFSDLQDIDEADRYKTAIEHLMLVKNSYDLAASTIKVSQPYRRQLLAEQFQTVNVNLVDVPASQFAPVTPTQAQLDEQFKKYADVNPEDMEKSPYGYGYRFPDRVKIQSIEIPVAEVRAAAEQKRNADAAAQYDWDRDAYKYYIANSADFATTQPAAGHATTRPFAEVKKEARLAVLDNDVTKLTLRIVDRITTQMASDYVAYRNAITTGGSNAKPPASSVTAPYNSYEYLQRLAEQVQKSLGMLPQLSSPERNYMREGELASLPGLGQSMVDNMPFAKYVLTRTAVFTSEHDEAKTMQLFEPSSVLHDEAGNSYFFRVTDAQKAHAPSSMQEVIASVTADVKAQGAFDQAKKIADQVLAQAKKAGSLQAGAAASNRNVIALSSVRFNDLTALAPVHLDSTTAQKSFLRQIFELMSSATKENLHPMGIIELPRDGRAMVAQLTDIHSDLTADDLAMLESQAGVQASRKLSIPLLAEWFSYDAIAARLKYVPTENKDRDRSSMPTNSSVPPAGQPLL